MQIAVAYAGMLAKVPTTIFVPTNVSPAKAKKIQSYGAKLVVGGASWAEANKDALALAATGPTYIHAFAGIAIPCCAAFETPLELTELDSETIFSIANDTAVVFDDAAHAREHSLEVQLPFLQTMLDHFKLLPLAIGTVTPEALAALLDKPDHPPRIWAT